MKTLLKNPAVQVVLFFTAVALLLLTFKYLGMDFSDKFHRGN